MLLLRALARCLAVSHDISAVAVVVQANDDAPARSNPTARGLLPLDGHEDILYMRTATVGKLEARQISSLFARSVAHILQALETLTRLARGCRLETERRPDITRRNVM